MRTGSFPSAKRERQDDLGRARRAQVHAEEAQEREEVLVRGPVELRGERSVQPREELEEDEPRIGRVKVALASRRSWVRPEEGPLGKVVTREPDGVAVDVIRGAGIQRVRLTAHGLRLSSPAGRSGAACRCSSPRRRPGARRLRQDLLEHLDRAADAEERALQVIRTDLHGRDLLLPSLEFFAKIPEPLLHIVSHAISPILACACRHIRSARRAHFWLR